MRGILNVQMIVAGDRVVVIEANPPRQPDGPDRRQGDRRDVVAAAVRCALGASLAEVGLSLGCRRRADRGGQDADGLAVAPAGCGRGPGTGDALDREVLGLAARYGGPWRSRWRRPQLTAAEEA